LDQELLASNLEVCNKHIGVHFISVTNLSTDKVVTLFNQGHQAGSLTPGDLGTGLGGAIDGTLREYAAFDETGVVAMPANLNFAEASTLSCAALTAWNALYGLETRALKPGDTVLTQGTGGVSIFALQFAKAAGATVISTTSSAEKAAILKKYGADHVINYKENPNWGEQARSLTPGQEGVKHVVEVGGPTTMAQSLKAVKIDGVISIIGFIGGFSKDQPTFLECLNNICTVRGLLVGSRAQFEDMNRAIEANDIHPVVDEKVFGLGELKEAYQYMWDQKHFGKLTIKIA
jgi:NADPH:quinone reductase-like Zn-dependent oxidoreductase